MQPSDSEDEVDSPEGPGASHIPATIYVIKFHPAVAREAIEWLIEKIEAKHKYGGAELLVRCEPQKQGQGVTVHVSATKIKLLEVAESADLQKKSSSGLIQEFSVRDLDQFLYPGLTLDTVLTPAEREFCVRHELDAIRAKQEEGHVPGHPNVTLYPGQSIVSVYVAEELITDMFPLHDRQALESLASRWYKAIFQSAPFEFQSNLAVEDMPIFQSASEFVERVLPAFKLPTLAIPFPKRKDVCDQYAEAPGRGESYYTEEIRSYFGESVAMYFSFLGYYTMALALPAALGLLQLVLSVDTLTEYALFAAFNLLWVTVVLEFWKRRCAELAYSWGTLERPCQVEARANFIGSMEQNPVTGRFEPVYPMWKTRCKMYFVTCPLVGLCLLGSLWMMVMAFWAEEQLMDWKKRYGSIAGIFMHVPSAFYAALVWLMNYYYKKLATRMTDWENHRTQYEYDWHRVSKLVVFEFVNNFSSLFYIAFYIQDMDMLCSQVATMLIVTQMINHFQEALLPYVVKKTYNQFADSVVTNLKKHPLTAKLFEDVAKPLRGAPLEEQPVSILVLDPKDPRIIQAREEADLDPYEDAYDDYLEMFLQFGYVFMFSSVYPMAAFWAVLNNILELKTDAFKLCRVYQRPRVKKVGSIGVWQGAFELIGAVAVMTNCALLCLSPRLRPLAPAASPVEWVLLFVLLEHLILLGKMALMWLVPDQPLWVRQALEKISYQSKLALKNERGKKTRRHLSRRFRSVHGMPRSGSRSRGTTPVAQNGGLRHRTPSGNYREY
ncbi:anoctamin-10-like isoform X1 [Macrobrachium nipponense]|uniref:anoctamin-10-like isoform X1 n=1 Tax=Macrobrachium nipponense TaxID=159736 RepID=UPI0030C84532